MAGGFQVSDFQIHLDTSAISALGGHEAVIETLTVLAQAGEGSAKDHAPFLTGTLRRSMFYKVFREKRPFARVGTNVFYAIYQEIGTRRHAAHPFLRPAMAAVERLIRGAR